MPLNVTKKLYRNINTGKLEELSPLRLSVFKDQYEEYDQKDTDCLTCSDVDTSAELDEIIDPAIDAEPKPTPKVVADKKETK